MAYMKKAVEEALLGVTEGHGGPFGAVIVKDGEIISVGHNKVVLTNDPTAHAEVVAIRAASEKLGRFDLSDCTLYTTCEPCPMCYGAIHWSRINTVYYGATREDAAEVGFDDSLIYDIMSGKKKPVIKMKQAYRDEAIKAFTAFKNKEDRVIY